MLDERKAAILQAVVQEYIRTAQPVGSNHVVAASAIDVSPATVRNEMAALEVDGYLQQPHTSAGRIPTDKGYRFFVDTLASPGPLDSARAQQVRTFFAHAHGALEQMLSDTSQLLTRLTHHAALVVGPATEAGDDPQCAARGALVPDRARSDSALERRSRTSHHRARRRAE